MKPNILFFMTDQMRGDCIGSVSYTHLIQTDTNDSRRPQAALRRGGLLLFYIWFAHGGMVCSGRLYIKKGVLFIKFL